MSSSFVSLNSVEEVDGSKVNGGSSPERSKILDLVRTISRKTNEDEFEKLLIVAENEQGIENMISKVQTNLTSLGPLEEPIDAQDIGHKYIPVPMPGSDLHEHDKWKYPLDEETGFRLVEFVEDDRDDPRTWPTLQKWRYTVLLGCVCLTVALTSSIVTGDTIGPGETFHVSQEVIVLTVSLLVIGFGIGPLVLSPLSEEFGRNAVYYPTLFIATIFIVPCGAAKNIGTLLVCRFLCGLFFSGPLCLIGGSLADMFRNRDRGIAMATFSAAPYLGPVIGPLIGGYIGDNAGWRWLYWVMLIISAVMWCIMVLFLPETHHQTILKRRAKKLRKLTGDPSYRALSEIKIRTLKEVAEAQLLRPLILLTEPIVFLFTLYMTINYGLLYMFFFAYPIIYMEGKGWSASKTGLMFIPIGVGVILATCTAKFVNDDYIKRAQPYYDKKKLPPTELRLIPMMICCWFLPVGLFAFAWSSFPHVHWAGPCISGLACGIGFIMVYNPANNYIVDTYQNYAASSLAAKTFVRSMWGGAVPLFTIQMYHKLGYEWASTLMAFISLACCAIPFVFYVYGAKIRERSKYSFKLEDDA